MIVQSAKDVVYIVKLAITLLDRRHPLQKDIEKIIRKVSVERAPEYTLTPKTHAKYYEDLQSVIQESADTKQFLIEESSPPNTIWSYYGGLLKEIEAAGRTQKEQDLQAAWFKYGDWGSYLGIKCTSEMFDTHKNPLPSGRKPDILHVIPGFQPSEVLAVAVGDLKRPPPKGEKFSGFPPDAQGRALDFARLIYDANPSRYQTGAISYLSDGVTIQFFLYCGEKKILRSPPMKLRNRGGRWLFGLMTTPLERFSMSILFKCTIIGREYALKYFYEQSEAVKERATLIQVRDNFRLNNFLTEPFNLTDDGKGILLSPVCVDISASSNFSGYDKSQLLQLYLVVQELHTAGWVHRDLRPSNILIQQTGDICLSDFSTCVRINESHPYSGTTKYASNSIILSLKVSRDSPPVLPALPEDDYASLVKICYVSVFIGSHKSLKRIRNDSYEEIQEFWRPRLDARSWQNLLNKTYDFIQFLDDFLP
eukprot:gene10059-10933_t